MAPGKESSTASLPEYGRNKVAVQADSMHVYMKNTSKTWKLFTQQ